MSLIPDPADLDDALIDAAAMLQHALEHGTDITDPINDDVTAILAAATWPGSETFRARSIGFRTGYANYLQRQIRLVFDPIFLGYLRVAKKDATVINLASWRDLFDYWISTGRLLQRRNPTFDTSIATTGTGNPTFRRLTVDRVGQVIESLFPESTKIEVKQSSPNTASFEETLEFRTEKRVDIFSLQIAAESNGDGKKTTYRQVNGDGSFLIDASFEFAGTTVAKGSLTSIGGWKDNLAGQPTSSVDAIAIIDDGYRQSTREKQNFDSDLTGSAPEKQCIRLDGDDIDIELPLRRLSDFKAYDGGVWIRKPTGSSATGTFSLTIGGATAVTQDVSLLSSNTWTLIALPLDSDNWTKTLKTTDAAFRIHTTSLADQLDIDAAFFHEMHKHNGSYWSVLPGTTPCSEDFTAQADDTIATDSVVQKLLSLGYPNQDYYLPSGAPPNPAALSEAGI